MWVTESCLFVQVVDDLNSPAGFDPYDSYRIFQYWNDAQK